MFFNWTWLLNKKTLTYLGGTFESLPTWVRIHHIFDRRVKVNRLKFSYSSQGRVPGG